MPTNLHQYKDAAGATRHSLQISLGQKDVMFGTAIDQENKPLFLAYGPEHMRPGESPRAHHLRLELDDIQPDLVIRFESAQAIQDLIDHLAFLKRDTEMRTPA